MSRDRTVVYTAVFNDYDALIKPPDTTDLDFVCFTDDPSTVPKGWDARSPQLGDFGPKLASGRVKTLPHKYITDYDYSIWVDGNVVVRKDPYQLVQKYLKKSKIAVPKHTTRNCIYEEARKCVNLSLIDSGQAEKLVKKYNREGFPRDFGLSETRILIREHTHKDVIDAMETWWETYREGPKRDQLSFEYSIWKNNIKYEQIPSGLGIESQYFQLYPHKEDVLFPDVYQLMLEELWNEESYSQYSVEAFVLSILINISNILNMVDLLQKGGISTVFNAFKKRYCNFC